MWFGVGTCLYVPRPWFHNICPILPFSVDGFQKLNPIHHNSFDTFCWFIINSAWCKEFASIAGFLEEISLLWPGLYHHCSPLGHPRCWLCFLLQSTPFLVASTVVPLSCPQLLTTDATGHQESISLRHTLPPILLNAAVTVVTEAIQSVL